MSNCMLTPVRLSPPSALPSNRIPVPQSRIRCRSGASATATQLVLPPYTRFSWVGVGTEPRTPQKRTLSSNSVIPPRDAKSTYLERTDSNTPRPFFGLNSPLQTAPIGGIGPLGAPARSTQIRLSRRPCGGRITGKELPECALTACCDEASLSRSGEHTSELQSLRH